MSGSHRENRSIESAAKAGERQATYGTAVGRVSANDGAKRLIHVEDVAAMRDSPTRLSARFANELYQQGESSIGYTIVTIVFSNAPTGGLF